MTKRDTLPQHADMLDVRTVTVTLARCGKQVPVTFRHWVKGSLMEDDDGACSVSTMTSDEPEFRATGDTAIDGALAYDDCALMAVAEGGWGSASLTTDEVRLVYFALANVKPVSTGSNCGDDEALDRAFTREMTEAMQRPHLWASRVAA